MPHQTYNGCTAYRESNLPFFPQAALQIEEEQKMQQAAEGAAGGPPMPEAAVPNILEQQDEDVIF